MARRKEMFGVIIFLGFIFITLTACSLATIPVGAIGSAAQWTAAGVSAHKDISRADVKVTTTANFDQASEVAAKCLEEQGLTVEDKKASEKNDGMFLTAKGQNKLEVKFAVAKITDNSSEIGIWTKKSSSRDIGFANLLAQEIKKNLSDKYGCSCEITQISETKKVRRR